MSGGQLVVQPVVAWPRRAAVDKSYFVTVDVTPLSGPEDWPSDAEEIALSCHLRAIPLFTSRPWGDTKLVIHRFGGSYGPVTFVVTPRGVLRRGELELTLVNERGVAVARLTLGDVEVVAAEETREETVVPVPSEEPEPAPEPPALPTFAPEPAEPPKEDLDRIVEELLPAVTVRIAVRGDQRGTGFLVAPDVVVTCAHVLRPLDLASSEAALSIEVTRLDGAVTRVHSVTAFSSEDDLAVLRVGPSEREDCALLEPGMRPSDGLVAFGYTTRHPEGIPVHLVAEGLTGDRKLVSLKSGQIQPGMAGAPVLNLRTGGVCGIVRRTRDARQELGGYAIPVSTLFSLDSTLESRNQRFHESNPSWLAALPDGTRVLRGRRSMRPPDLPAELVLILRERGSELEVAAEAPEVGPIGPERADLNTVRRELMRLATAREGSIPLTERARMLGRVIFATLFPGRVADAFHELYDRAEVRGLSISLAFELAESRELLEFPWEQAYADLRGSRAGVHLGIDRRLTFARVVRTGEGDLRRPVAPGVPRVAVVVGRSAAIELDDEALQAQDLVAAALEEDLSTLRARVRVVQSTRLAELASAMATGVHDIVHYVGFAAEEARQPGIRLGDSLVSPEMLTDALQPASPRAVVVQTCTARIRSPLASNLASGAAALISADTEAAIVSAAPARHDILRQFNGQLYRSLADGSPIDWAVQRARFATYLDAPTRADWSEMTLTMRAPRGIQLFPHPDAEERSQYLGAASGYG